MEKLTNEQWLEKYPYLKEMTEYTLFTSKEDIDYIVNSEKVRIDNEEVSVEFVTRILNNKLYFK